jgi:hypothetical protein
MVAGLRDGCGLEPRPRRAGFAPPGNSRSGRLDTGVIDPAGLGSSPIDGRTLMQLYGQLGLHLGPAENAVEAGTTGVWDLLVSGRPKVMESLSNWRREFRKYHRDDKGSGKIVKRDDHLMDSTRYLIVSGRPRMCIRPQPQPRRRSQRLEA